MNIDFCKCGGMMMPDKGTLKCRSCGLVVKMKIDGKIVDRKEKKKEIVVIEDNSPDLPKTDRDCPNCEKLVQAYFWMIQTRSSDEPPTQFFRCTQCNHVWREYK